MGLLSGSVDTLKGDAHRAALEGRTIYACTIAQSTKLNTTRTNGTWAEGITAIEACGWRLDQFTAETQTGSVVAHCVFRRV